MLVITELCLYGEQMVWKSLYLSLNFAVNLRVLLKKNTLKKAENKKATEKKDCRYTLVTKRPDDQHLN